MKIIEKCLLIIQNTNDGDLLSPADLQLTELAVNGQLSDRGHAALDSLLQAVLAGTYMWRNSRGYGLHLTIRDNGYVYWRNTCVEHYSYSDKDAERKAAKELADRCLSLESRGLPVTGRSASPFSPFSDAPAGTAWVEAMSAYYTMFAKDGKPSELILYRDDGNVVSLSMVCGEPVVRFSPPGKWAYDMYHTLQREGLESCGDQLDTYAGFVAQMTAAGITPEAVSRARAVAYPTI